MHKVKIRQKTVKLIRQGKIKKTPCENCGETKVEAHHTDYRTPYRIKFFCKGCHDVEDSFKRTGGRRKGSNVILTPFARSYFEGEREKMIIALHKEGFSVRDMVFMFNQSERFINKILTKK